MSKRPGNAGKDPTASGAAKQLRTRQRAVVRALRGLASASSGPKRIRAAHFVRVSTRRAAVAVVALEELIGRRRSRRAKRVLKAIRRACGSVRDCDVLIGWVSKERNTAQAATRVGLDLMLKDLRSMLHPEQSARRRRR
jgi:CHAD domain-containing protein